jgi:hypothetical protein
MKLPKRELDKPIIRYEELSTGFKKGLRNGNWRKFHRLEKALFRASLWYSKVHNVVISELLVRKLSVLLDKLKTTAAARIMKRGFEIVSKLLNDGEDIFAWATSLGEWLKDPDYVFWLGTGGLKVEVRAKI